MPFERLMEYAASLGEADWELSLSELAARVSEPAERLADAVTALRVMNGRRPYVMVSPVVFLRAQSDPVVARAMEEDRGTIVSGAVLPPSDQEE